MVAIVGELSKTEREAQPLDPAARLSLRRQHAKPVLDTLHRKLSDWKLRLLPKYPISEATGDVLRQLRELTVFAG